MNICEIFSRQLSPIKKKIICHLLFYFFLEGGGSLPNRAIPFFDRKKSFFSG